MSTPTTSSASHHSNVVPSEVGWQFVPQYYTFVNKEPHRLHCFYSKNSTFIHGTEGEEVKPCYGQQEIHNKITSIGFEDCKVFIHSVDAQSSANGGIFIQVIGEMSNHGEPWRKFVQSFFLAEQPNGYFVLNDIFRFLKEETVDGDDASDTAESETVAASIVTSSEATIVSVVAPEPVYEPPREPTPPPAVVAEPVVPVAAPQVEETPVPEPVITQTPTPAPEEQEAQQQPVPAQPNGIHTPEPEVAAQIQPPSPKPQEEQPAAPAPVTPARVATPAAPAAAPAAAAPVQPAAAPAQPPRPAAPAAPRSWASLAASNSKKWGAAVAQESRGTTEVLSTPAPAPVSQPAAPAPATAAQRPQGQQQQNGREHQALVAAQSVTTAQCFVKGVIEPISQTALANTLTTRFGAIKEIEIVRAKACAFIEFQTVDSAKRAIIASLSQNQGGEGGVWIDAGGDVGQVRISVETKKERGDRPPTRPRGGAPAVNGDGRGAPGGGAFRGRGRGGGRGAAAAK